MKKLLFITLFLPFVVFGQTNPIPDLPSDVSTWGEKEVFIAGLGAGFVLGASGFILRIIRQAARQNPEI